MTVVRMHNPDPILPPRRLGRVYSDDVDLLWTSDGWTSDRNPEEAELLTGGGYGKRLETCFPNAHQEVLEKVASFFEGAKWECFLEHDSVPRIY